MVGEGEVNFLVFFSVFSSRRNSLEGVRAESSSRGGGGGKGPDKKMEWPNAIPGVPRGILGETDGDT